jgi:hypothetical protein
MKQDAKRRHECKLYAQETRWGGLSVVALILVSDAVTIIIAACTVVFLMMRH